ncbi:hypothetical protein [Citrobacter portucalensis]|uniref:hypothetical protein n=1 Tax=Citrobacter portucalensis TaxID=1639133 RepID=UPI00254CB220|nr:hypothetical protein [Citrobacter portucalensis]
MRIKNKGAKISKRHHIIFSLVLMMCPASVLADDDCQITSDKQILNFGRFNSNEMEHGSSEFSGRTIDWRTVASREFHLFVTCNTPRKVRLFIDAPLQPAHHRFRFSTAGTMVLTFRNAHMDNQSMMLKSVTRGQNAPVEGGGYEWEAGAGQGVAFTNGSELAGTRLDITLQIKPYLLPLAFSSRDIDNIEESMLVSMETYPVK